MRHQVCPLSATTGLRLRPDIALGAAIIVGFPTETEEMFARSLDLVAECDLTFLHVFPYSKRPGTPAARMPQIQGGAIRERAKQLGAAGKAALRRRNLECFIH